jgi:hypothetical protein
MGSKRGVRRPLLLPGVDLKRMPSLYFPRSENRPTQMVPTNVGNGYEPYGPGRPWKQVPSKTAGAYHIRVRGSVVYATEMARTRSFREECADESHAANAARTRAEKVPAPVAIIGCVYVNAQVHFAGLRVDK